MKEREPNQKEIRVEWSLIDKLSINLSRKIRDSGKAFNSIYGILRGGVVIAVMLSYRLNIPVVEKEDINPGTLIVDSISDSGTTLNDFRQGFYFKFPQNEMVTAVLFQREDTMYEASFVGKYIQHKLWLHFPYEN